MQVPSSHPYRSAAQGGFQAARSACSPCLRRPTVRFQPACVGALLPISQPASNFHVTKKEACDFPVTGQVLFSLCLIPQACRFCQPHAGPQGFDLASPLLCNVNTVLKIGFTRSHPDRDEYGELPVLTDGSAAGSRGLFQLLAEFTFTGPH